MSTYGYLAMERINRWRVRAPEAEPPHLLASEREAEEVRSTWITEHELPKAIEEWERARSAFYDGCEVVTEEVSSGFRVLTQRRVSLPNGGQPLVGDRDPAEVVEEAWIAQSPEPSTSYLSNSAATVDRVVVWRAELFLDGKSRPLPLIEQWAYGLPIEAVLETLNKLAADGWSVVQASEDRGLYAGTTVSSDAYVTRVRYLLAR